MGKKKREHIVFDEMRKVKKSIPFSKVNKTEGKRKDIKVVIKYGTDQSK
jgi:hypothetical protein